VFFLPKYIKSDCRDESENMLDFTSKASLYIKFLGLVKAVNELPQFPALDPAEERLLNYLALIWYSDKKLTVGEAIQASTETSPSTVHRRLKMLRKKGLIYLDVDQIDNRIKYIKHTDLTDLYFLHLGQRLSMAVYDY
jgi:DNA-binding MarR family transcriptional regulator